jgi:hypothetical protein
MTPERPTLQYPPSPIGWRSKEVSASGDLRGYRTHAYALSDGGKAIEFLELLHINGSDDPYTVRVSDDSWSGRKREPDYDSATRKRICRRTHGKASVWRDETFLCPSVAML